MKTFGKTEYLDIKDFHRFLASAERGDKITYAISPQFGHDLEESGRGSALSELRESAYNAYKSGRIGLVQRVFEAPKSPELRVFHYIAICFGGENQ